MSDGFHIVTPASLDGLDGVPWLLSHAFGSSEADASEWLKRHEAKNVRVAREGDGGSGGRALGCLLMIPMGQFFGGRSVPMVGIAGVAVSPEARGCGVATALMTGLVCEMQEQGVALSALYPATVPLYRRAGYEFAGHLCRVTFRARAMRLAEGAGDEVTLRRAEGEWNGEGDHRRIREFYRREAARMHGAIDRSELMWDRIVKPRGNETKCFIAERAGQIEGYLYLWMAGSAGALAQPAMQITDMQARTPEAGRRLLSFIAEHRSLDHEAVWHAGPAHPLLSLLAEPHYRIEKKDYWMLRVVDMARALRGRGYNPLTTARLEVEVTDDLVEANRGVWTLRIEQGRASAERTAGGGGATAAPRVALDVRALAMLYSGFLTPWQMRSAGMLEGSDEGLAAAAAVFGGDGAAWMTDQF